MEDAAAARLNLRTSALICRCPRGHADVGALRLGIAQAGRVSELTVDEAEAVRSWLERHQFEHVSTVGGDSAAFGDRLDIWERSGTRFRLTRDRGQWWYDISRDGADLWLDVDGVAGAMGSKLTVPVERVADLASSIDDRVFVALSTVVQPAP